MAVLKASPPTFGESVLGAALIWMALHCRHTNVAGRCSLSPRPAARIKGEWPCIMSVVEPGQSFVVEVAENQRREKPSSQRHDVAPIEWEAAGVAEARRRGVAGQHRGHQHACHRASFACLAVHVHRQSWLCSLRGPADTSITT